MFEGESETDRAFREEVRDWLENNLPAGMRNLAVKLTPEEIAPWYGQVLERGWHAPHWPKSAGGMGATLTQQIILAEEFARAGAPETHATHALNLVGPVLIEFGTEEQKAKFLPPILASEVIWCQGYSEPNAGSDLASLKTTAILGFDEFVVNGQKIWTTMGTQADWMFALVCTDPGAAKKQGGLSVILIDLTSPGVTRRPIKVLSGDDELAEEFFDDVRVPVENLVGELHDGWRVANSILGTERFSHGHPRHCYSVLEAVKRVAKKTGAMDDPAFRDRLAAHEINVTAFAAFFRHALELTEAEISPGWAASILKLYCTEEIQRLDDLLVEAAGGYGLDKEIVVTDEGGVDIMGRFLGDRRNTIGGGSREIQRNIISKRVLGLPT
ncbi:MAG: acyl-CoA dehydrogenase family protein [Rhodospirillales bacterium]|nr:acyl-CoA dehydrogenase family protein [Rhodospirillales bacterium]